MKQRILIVDDSPLLRKTARRAAMQAGAEPERIREAGNGREALAALAVEPADIVLLDINMPPSIFIASISSIIAAAVAGCGHRTIECSVSCKGNCS